MTQQHENTLSVVIAALLCAVAYTTGILMFVALLPLWWIFYRRGRAQALGALVLAAFGSAAGVFISMPEVFRGHGITGLLVVEAGILVSIFLTTVLWMVKPAPLATPAGQILSSVICTVVFVGIPFIVFRDQVSQAMNSMIIPLYESLGLTRPDAKTASLFMDLATVTTPLGVLVITGLNRHFARGILRIGIGDMPPLGKLQMPNFSVWAFIAGIGGCCLLLVRDFPPVWRSILLLYGGMVICLFILQGIGIAQALLFNRGFAGLARLVPVVVVIFTIMVAKAAVVLFLGLALFGVSETWIPWRLRSENNRKES